MPRDSWSRLAAPFQIGDLTWRVVAVDAESRRALVRPRLRVAVVAARLDAELGVAGWSNNFRLLGRRAMACHLTIAGVTKAAVVTTRGGVADMERLSEDALARAAELFGLVPPVDPTITCWVDYDPETGEPLHEPELTPSLPSIAATAPGAIAESAEAPVTAVAREVIDRLVERLKMEGLGIEAARLLVAYGGYGRDAVTARELYAKLRNLLVDKGTVTSC